jgi:putative heme-binding domain-containing protein
MNFRTLPAILALTAVALADERGDHLDTQPSTPQEQLARFKVPPGFEVQLVAAEPEIQKPINLNFDAAGRLWVTGSEMYPWPASTDPNGQPIPGFDKGWQGIVDGFKVGEAPAPAEAGRDTVRILSDFDATGHAQKISVFADKLNIPSGIQPLPHGSPAIAAVYGLPPPYDPNPAMRKRGPIADRHLGKAPKGDTAIVYSIPNIWMLTDWDGDGFAESRLPLYTGFGYTDTHGGSSSFLYWIDGWIYATHGFRNRSEVRDLNGHVTVVDSGNTFRFRPDGTDFEIFTHGQSNPFGLTVDPLGNFYSADSHSKPVYMLLRGGYYEGIGKQHDGLGFAPRITDDDHGSSAIAGIAYYADDKWPEEFRGNLFNGNPVTQKINRDRLEWTGSTPKAIRMPDFLSCDDPWFRPVNLKFGPDGALYIADFYNPVIGHYEVPLTHPARDHSHGRIWRVVWRGENKEAPAPAAPDLSHSSATVLITKLADPSLEIRRLATQELVDRFNDDATERLALVYSGSGKGKTEQAAPAGPAEQFAHILWALERLNSLDPGLLKKGVTQASPIVRNTALKIIAERTELDPTTWGWTHTAGDPTAQRTATEAWSLHPSRNNVQPLLYLIEQTPKADLELAYAARVALRDQLTAPAAVRTAAYVVETHPEWAELLADAYLGLASTDAADFLLSHLGRTGLGTLRASEYLKHTARNLPAERFGEAASLLTKAGELPLAQHLALAAAISDTARERSISLDPETTAWTQRAMLEALDSADDALARQAMDALEHVKIDAKLEPLTRIAQDEKRDVAVRIDALSAAANLPASRALLTTALADRTDARLCRRAARLLIQNDAADLALTALPGAPWELATGIAYWLSQTDTGTASLLDAVESGKVAPRVLLDRSVSGSLFSRPQALRDRAKALTKDLPPEDDRLDKLITERTDAYRKAQPDTTHGAQVFQQNCAACHRLRNEGGNVGPNLDGVIARGPQRLIEDILDPNRNVDPGFRQTIVETQDGQTYAGANVREQGEALLLTDATGKEQAIPKSAIKTRTNSLLSLMPSTFETQLSPADLNDLLAFLLSSAK